MSDALKPDTSLWSSDSVPEWNRALDSYDEVVERQGVSSLAELDRWVRVELPGRIAERGTPHVTLEELAKVTRWKMARGVWRARNLSLVESNGADVVVETSREALTAVPDPRRPIAILARLQGVGPATASVVAAAAAPERYPFFDELVAEQVPGLGTVAFTLPYYLRYAEAIRSRAGLLPDDWTPALVERALWAHSGGKAGRARGR